MATRKIRQKVIVFIVAFCLMIPMTSFVSAAGGLSVNIDENGISWSSIAGVDHYFLEVENGYQSKSFSPEETSWDLICLNQFIDFEIMNGSVDKGSSYDIRVEAFDENGDQIAFGTVSYAYSSEAVKIEPESINGFSFDTASRTASWNPYDFGTYAAVYPFGYEFGFEDEDENSSYWDENGTSSDYSDLLEYDVSEEDIEGNSKYRLFVRAVIYTPYEDEFGGIYHSVTLAESATDYYTFSQLLPNSLKLAKISVSNATYTGKEVKPNPVVMLNGKKLIKGKDYDVDYEDNIDAGDEACVDIYGINDYSGYVYKYFTIYKASNKLSVKGKTAKVKFSKLKKKAQKLSVSKVLKFKNKGQGKLSFKKVSGNKKIKIDKKTGKVTVGKGLRKGTYKIKVKVKAAGNDNYKASSWKTVKFKISVK